MTGKGMCIMVFCLLGISISVEAARVKRALPPQGGVTVYIDEHYKGTSEPYILPKWVCVDIDPSFRGFISSIKPEKGTCVQVFKAQGCPASEAPKKLKEHDFGTDNLAKIRLNDKISSLKLC